MLNQLLAQFQIISQCPIFRLKLTQEPKRPKTLAVEFPVELLHRLALEILDVNLKLFPQFLILQASLDLAQLSPSIHVVLTKPQSLIDYLHERFKITIVKMGFDLFGQF